MFPSLFVYYFLEVCGETGEGMKLWYSCPTSYSPIFDQPLKYSHRILQLFLSPANFSHTHQYLTVAIEYHIKLPRFIGLLKVNVAMQSNPLTLDLLLFSLHLVWGESSPPIADIRSHRRALTKRGRRFPNLDSRISDSSTLRPSKSRLFGLDAIIRHSPLDWGSQYLCRLTYGYWEWPTLFSYGSHTSQQIL